jgi:hypothetical protein
VSQVTRRPRLKKPEIGNITNHSDKVVIRQSGNITKKAGIDPALVV